MRLQTQKALVLALAICAGCGSSESKTEPTADAAVQDAKPGLMDSVVAKMDVGKASDTKVDKVAPSPDTGVEALAADTSTVSTPDAFVPGPVVPMTVNSGNTADFNLAADTWKVFSFDTVQGHLYLVGVLPDGVEAYVGQSPSVSPYEYIEKTNYQRSLTFTSSSGGKYYVAVVANGASASGSFQIADGGDLVEVSEEQNAAGNTVDLSAPNGEATSFYYFAVAPGHGYTVSVTGAAKSPVTLSLSPLADRSKAGEFEFPLSSKTGPLPIENELIPYESVAKSSSRLYFLYVKVKETVSLTIKVTLAS